jgi:hypothetical protein
MRYLACLLIVAAAWAGDAPKATVKPVQFLVCAPLPAELPFSAKPFGHEPGFKIAWLIEGEDLIGISEGSLVVTALKTPDGKNLAVARNGSTTWKLGSFPKVSDDGRFAVFTIDCSAQAFGQVEQLSIEGSVAVMTGSDRRTEELAFDPEKPSKATVGPLTIDFGAKDDMPMMGGGYGISVTGPREIISSIEIMDGGKRLKRRGSSYSNNVCTYQFDRPTNPAPKLQLAWWGKTGEFTLALKR